MNLGPPDDGAYLRLTGAGPKTLTIGIGVVADGREFHVANRAINGNLTLVPHPAVTMNLPAGGTLVLAPGHTVTIKGIASNNADLFGATVLV